MIPKILHYCWFGLNPMPKILKKCLKTWSKFCPDFEILKWDETNFDINSIPFVKEAYEAKKFAFVADCVRLYALTKYGGIYLDTDVQLLKPLDNLLSLKAFAGFEDEKLINAAVVGCEKDNEFFSKLFDYYKNRHFKNKNNEYEMVSIPVIFTKMCEEIGIKINNELQKNKLITIFPKDYFYPKDYATGLLTLTDRSYCIHHYDASWFDKKRKKQLKQSWRKNKIKRFLVALFGERMFGYLRKKRKRN